jgi:hypothetical protein
MRCLFYLFYYNSLFSNLVGWSLDKDHQACYIEEGKVTEIVFFYINIGSWSVQD